MLRKSCHRSGQGHKSIIHNSGSTDNVGLYTCIKLKNSDLKWNNWDPPRTVLNI